MYNTKCTNKNNNNNNEKILYTFKAVKQKNSINRILLVSVFNFQLQ